MVRHIDRESTCSICLDEFSDSKMQLIEQGSSLKSFLSKLRKKKDMQSRDHIRAFPECRHLFHENCLVKWIEESDSCPMCRRKSSSSSSASGGNIESDDSVDDDIENLFFEPEVNISSAINND